MGVTAHFIHGDALKQEQVFLDLAAATGPSTSDATVRQLQDILEKYSIKAKLESVTIDNGRNVVSIWNFLPHARPCFAAPPVR